MPSVRVAVFSDDRLFGEGLLLILAAEPSITVVDGVGEKPVPSPRRAAGPHVLVVDSRTDGALDLCAARRRNGGPAVILVAATDDDAWAQQALGAGARGILPKRARPEDLVQAVRVVHGGGVWAPRRVMADCIERLTTATATPEGEGPLEQRLSSREQEVFRHAASGLSNKELADRLAISRATVKAHLSQIFQKLGVNGRAQLAAVYHGVFPSTGRSAVERPANGRTTQGLAVRREQ